jgi:arylsulfatase A-like enzyme
MPETGDEIVLGRGWKQMEIRACPAAGALESALAARDPRRPVFFWSLPQDVHLGVITKVNVPDGETYPGFFDKVASQVRRLDACVGRFVDILQRAHLYDDSIIVLTADHGDLYGVEGRWGHANLLYPDVMRVPLIVHVPPHLRAGLRTDLSEVAFLTDLTPTLYRLLGYDPQDLGTLFGRSLFADADADVRSRRDDDFLVASAYGAVYGVVRQNGRQLYVVDTIEGREYLADMSGAAPRSLETTPAVTAANRDRIRRDIDRLSALYHFRP